MSWRAIGAAALVLTSLGGCSGMERLGQIGQPPQFDPIINPVQQPDYVPVSLPMPAPSIAPRHANSLWRPGARAFFKDQRAARVGDILTVEISIDDDASISNESVRTRDLTEDVAWGGLLGYEQSISGLLPQAFDSTSVIDLDTEVDQQGSGEITRDDEINLVLAAIVTQVLPNGNMVIEGEQEVRVNFELRELQVQGIVRPEDITATNTVPFEKIAEARMAYGGRGHITDVQQPRYGAQVLDVIMPF